MKTSLFIKQTALIASLLLAAAFQAIAQPGPGGGMRGMLTEEQRTKLRDAMQANQSEMTQLTEKLTAAQKEAIKAALAEKPDESLVRSKVEAVAKIQTEIAMLRFKGVKEIKFTDEQKSQMDERPFMGYMTMFGGFGGGGGRRGPGGPGGPGGGSRGNN